MTPQVLEYRQLHIHLRYCSSHSNTSAAESEQIRHTKRRRPRQSREPHHLYEYQTEPGFCHQEPVTAAMSSAVQGFTVAGVPVTLMNPTEVPGVGTPTL